MSAPAAGPAPGPPGGVAHKGVPRDRREPVTPSLSDEFIRGLSQRIGGPLGRRAAAGAWWNPARWALLTATLVYLVGVIFRLPCTVSGQDHFKYMCYSDIGILYSYRGLADGNVPYFDSGDYPVLEYPVLTGWFVDLARRLTVALGAPVGPGLNSEQLTGATTIFVTVNTVLLGACLLVAIWAQVRTVPHRPWDAMMVAASPCLAAAALINWDLFAFALTALGMMFWARRRPAAAGVLWGLAMAAKLYPLFLLGPLLLLCLRSARMRAFGVMLLGFVISWAVVNLPVLLLVPDAWFSFWNFNSERGADLGSIWYVLSLAGIEVSNLNSMALIMFALGCLAIAASIILAPRRPRFGAVAFLVLAAFLLSNKVYSPQYMLWLLPFVVLARPVWRDWLVFTAGELIYFGAIWWHLGGFLSPGSGGADRVYWLAVLLRMATQTWVVIMVVRDALLPRYDVVRDGGFDDPTGGVLDEAPDAAWIRRLRPVRPEPTRAG